VDHAVENSMRKFRQIIGASVPYVFFIFFLTTLAWAFKSNWMFHFRNGDTASKEQNYIYCFVLFLMVIVSGYAAFKTAKAHWKLWKKSRKTACSQLTSPPNSPSRLP
jgi:hypothetical protein